MNDAGCSSKKKTKIFKQSRSKPALMESNEAKKEYNK